MARYNKLVPSFPIRVSSGYRMVRISSSPSHYNRSMSSSPSSLLADGMSRFNNVQDFLQLLLDPRKASWSFYPLATLAKYAFYLLLLLNMRSLPLVWHIRVFRPVFAMSLRRRWLTLRTALMSREQKAKEEDKWMDQICPVGQDPFEAVVLFKTWASMDESDFLGHLSNSSYAKTCDMVRFKAALQFFPLFFAVGGWMPLAATHYNFIRELPMFAPYEVRLTIDSWDHKWLHVTLKFTTRRKTSKRDKTKTGKSSHDESTNAPGTPAEPLASSSATETNKTLHAVSHGLRPKEAKVTEESDDTILHAVAVSRLCFKMGRITVPPAVVLALHGFSVAPTQGPLYSHGNPPPSFIEAKKVTRLRGGNAKRLIEFCKEGWKAVPSGQRWWEDALGGSVEARRTARLGAMEALARGAEESRR